MLAIFGLGPMELIVVGLIMLVPAGFILLLLKIASSSRSGPTHCPHCGGDLRGHR